MGPQVGAGAVVVDPATADAVVPPSQLDAWMAKADYVLHDKDVFVNVVGGLRITEPAADLAVAAAIVSSLLGRCVHCGCGVLLSKRARPVRGGRRQR